MIRTSTQLKAKVRNLSAGDNDRAKLLIRNYVMERFLERIALSQYRNNFILGTKGDIDESVIVISADANPEKIRIDTGETTKTVIASVRV